MGAEEGCAAAEMEAALAEFIDECHENTTAHSAQNLLDSCSKAIPEGTYLVLSKALKQLREAEVRDEEEDCRDSLTDESRYVACYYTNVVYYELPTGMEEGKRIKRIRVKNNRLRYPTEDGKSRVIGPLRWDTECFDFETPDRMEFLTECPFSDSEDDVHTDFAISDSDVPEQ